ncbi:hypothetical protein SESBI_03613 [Sesbania bispinosa]|nr:hypothetical protein SESBI_03613 [Sesbania bispinosa]
MLLSTPNLTIDCYSLDAPLATGDGLLFPPLRSQYSGASESQLLPLHHRWLPATGKEKFAIQMHVFVFNGE